MVNRRMQPAQNQSNGKSAAGAMPAGADGAGLVRMGGLAGPARAAIGPRAERKGRPHDRKTYGIGDRHPLDSIRGVTGCAS